MTSGKQPVSSRHRALVVEDDPAIRRLVAKLLGRHEIETETACDGLAAIAMLRDRQYTFVVLDLMVPEINGFEVIDFLRREGKDIPVAVVSAVSQQALARLDQQIVKLVISKPFDIEEFTAGVLQLCRAEDERQAAKG